MSNANGGTGRAGRGGARRWAAVSVIAVAPLIALLVRLLWGGDVPDPLPTHWNANGAVDGQTGATTFFVGCLAVSVALGAVGAAGIFGASAAAARFWAGAGAFAAWLSAGIYVETVIVSHGRSTADYVANPWWAVLGMILVVLAGSALTVFLTPGPDYAARTVATPHSSLQLRPGERVVWFGDARSNNLRWMAAVLGIGAAAAAIWTVWSIALPILIVALTLAATSEVTVRVDDRGLHTLWGPVRWPRMTIRLDDMVSVTATEIEPTAWGGWGYRITPRGHATVIRRGPGLVVERRDRPTYAVTVDHADRAADLLHALLARTSPTER